MWTKHLRSSGRKDSYTYIQYIRLKKKCSFVWRISMLWWMHLNETHWFILNCHNQIWIRRHCGWCVCVFVCVKVNNARAYIHKHPVHYNVSAAQFTWKFWMTSQISGERKCAFPPQHHSDTQTKQILWIPLFWWRAASQAYDVKLSMKYLYVCIGSLSVWSARGCCWWPPAVRRARTCHVHFHCLPKNHVNIIR